MAVVLPTSFSALDWSAPVPLDWRFAYSIREALLERANAVGYHALQIPRMDFGFPASLDTLSALRESLLSLAVSQFLKLGAAGPSAFERSDFAIPLPMRGETGSGAADYFSAMRVALSRLRYVRAERSNGAWTAGWMNDPDGLTRSAASAISGAIGNQTGVRPSAQAIGDRMLWVQMGFDNNLAEYYSALIAGPSTITAKNPFHTAANLHAWTSADGFNSYQLTVFDPETVSIVQRSIFDSFGSGFSAGYNVVAPISSGSSVVVLDSGDFVPDTRSWNPVWSLHSSPSAWIYAGLSLTCFLDLSLTWI